MNIVLGRQAIRSSHGNRIRRLIVLFHTGHPNDFTSAEYQRRGFGEFGYTIEEYSVMDPQIVQKLGSLFESRSTDIAFFLSSNYYGARVSNGEQQLLHTMTGIPLVIMHHDHPLHFLQAQSPQLDDTITFAIGDESVDFIKQYYPVQTSIVTRSGARPQVRETIPTYERFLAKANVILCPMNLAVNGLGLDGTWQLIKQLPEPRRTSATQLAELAMSDCFTPLHMLAQSLPSIDPAHQRAAVRDQLLVLNFIKVWRRNFMVRELIDLPILVSSEYVPADIEFKYRKKVTLLSRTQTMSLYDKYRFILNCNPVMTNVLHERVLEALYTDSVAITDPNSSIARYLEDGRDYISFVYDKGDMKAKVASYLDDSEKAYVLTERAYEARQASRDFGLVDSYARLLDAVDTWWANRAPAAANRGVSSKSSGT